MSVTFFEKALASLKKANKDAKLRKAINAGYSTVEKYQEFLEAQIKLAAPAEVVKESKPKAKKKETAKEAKAEPVELTDLVIAFDTTGSMDAYIGNVKSHVKTLIPNLFKENPNLKISVVAFGDYCDMRSSTDFGNAYQVLELTNDEQALIKFVTNAKGTGGGDSDEFYELVIQKICSETAWREGSNKSVLFIADANPHPVGYTYGRIIQNNQIDWRKEAVRANAMGIKFDTLRIHPDKSWYKELSELTEGVCLDFKSSSKTSQVVEATVLARGGESTRAAFMAKSTSTAVVNDVELNAVYTMYKSVID